MGWYGYLTSLLCLRDVWVRESCYPRERRMGQVRAPSFLNMHAVCASCMDARRYSLSHSRRLNFVSISRIHTLCFFKEGSLHCMVMGTHISHSRSAESFTSPLTSRVFRPSGEKQCSTREPALFIFERLSASSHQVKKASSVMTMRRVHVCHTLSQ